MADDPNDVMHSGEIREAQEEVARLRRALEVADAWLITYRYSLRQMALRVGYWRSVCRNERVDVDGKT